MFFSGPAMMRPFLIAIGVIIFLIVMILAASSRRRRRLRGIRGRAWTCCNELCRSENSPHARFCGMCGMARSREKLDL